MSTLKDVTDALHKKAGFEVTKVEEGPHRVLILGRVLPAATGNWKLLRGHLWKTANGKKSKTAWKVDVSCWYFVDEDAGDLQRFAWRLIFTSKEDLQILYSDICRVVGTSPVVVADVMEVVLPGASRSRNDPAGGQRGAALMGKAVVGPAAVMSRTRGG